MNKRKKRHGDKKHHPQEETISSTAPEGDKIRAKRQEKGDSEEQEITKTIMSLSKVKKRKNTET